MVTAQNSSAQHFPREELGAFSFRLLDLEPLWVHGLRREANYIQLHVLTLAAMCDMMQISVADKTRL